MENEKDIEKEIENAKEEVKKEEVKEEVKKEEVKKEEVKKEEVKEKEINEEPKKKSGHPFLKGLLAIMILIILLGVIVLMGARVDNTKTDDEFDNSVKTVVTDDEANTKSVYDNNVDGVISVMNLKKINVNNSLIQEYLDAQTDGQGVEQSVGSGFVYKKENGYYYAVTNNHVVEGSDNLEVVLNKSDLNKDKKIYAQTVGVDTAYDIAVIKFKSSQDIKPLTFGDSSKIFPGEKVMAIGSPYGVDFQGSITQGIISAPLRTATSKDNPDTELKYIQTDAAINPGNSGGPLLDAQGNVIGMNTLKIADTEADNMGFAIPSAVVKDIITQIEQKFDTNGTATTVKDNAGTIPNGTSNDNSSNSTNSSNNDDSSNSLNNLLKNFLG